MIVDGELRELEERLTAPGTSESRTSLAALLAADFREIGSSGRIADATAVLDGLLGGSRPKMALEDFTTTSVAPGVMLVTYVSKCLPGAGWKPPALRSSLWCWREGRWQLVFHQGTVMPAAGQ